MLERLGSEGTFLAPREATIERRRLGSDLLSTLIRLFLFHEPVPSEAIDGVAAEFLERAGGFVTSNVAVQPWRGALVAHDWSEGPEAEEHVVGASASTAALADFTVRRRVGSALDLCAGSGAQAVLTSRHADRVVAVELNPRALKLARWTLDLNDVDNVELRHGNVLELLPGERFDLVTANPPYVVSPDVRWLFRDAVEGISRGVVERAAEALAEGGFAHVLAQWGLRSGDRWDEQPAAWVAGRGCDAWILRLPTPEDVLDHAGNWNRFLRADDPHDYEQTVDRWIEHFARVGIEKVVTGAIVLRRRQGRIWVRSDEGSSWPAEPVGDHVERLFAGQTLVDSLPATDALLDLRLEPVDGFRLDETRSYVAGGFSLVAAQARGSLPLRVKVTRTAVRVLSQLDGNVRLRELEGAEAALSVIGELVALGLLRTP